MENLVPQSLLAKLYRSAEVHMYRTDKFYYDQAATGSTRGLCCRTRCGTRQDIYYQESSLVVRPHIGNNHIVGAKSITHFKKKYLLLRQNISGHRHGRELCFCLFDRYLP